MTLGYQISLGVVYGMCCCGVCSSSAGHRFSPHTQTDRYCYRAKLFVLGTIFFIFFIISGIVPFPRTCVTIHSANTVWHAVLVIRLPSTTVVPYGRHDRS